MRGFLSNHLLTKDLFINHEVENAKINLNLSGLVKSVTKSVTGCLKPTKMAIFVV